MKHLYIILLCFLFVNSYAQTSENLFSRLSGIKNFETYFYNIDGIEISYETVNSEFSVKNISRNFRKHSVKKQDLVASDSSLQMTNYYFSRSKSICPGVTQNTSYYFIENNKHQLAFISFDMYNKSVRDFERNFVNLIYTNAIPDSIYSPMKVSEVNFAGRKFPVANNCRWMGVNNLQCSSFGQMNWSVHESLEDAAKSVEEQFKTIEASNKGKFISEEIVDVIFEGENVKAKKTIYDFTGVTSIMAGMTGGKTLTVYFVASPVRQNFVSCVMSFWNNDHIGESGLSPLLEQVMQLK